MARIVLIDDEMALGEVCAEILDAEGHQTVLANTGLSGLAAVRRERPDLVICDVQMPGMDGYSVLKAVRGDPEIASTPFLFLTSLADRQDIRTGMSLGADDYLGKPIASAELVAAVEARLARRDLSRREAERQMDALRRSVAVLLPHELRTPLTVILGTAQFLQESHGTLTPDSIEAMAASIMRAAERLHRMTENYLLYAELELQRLTGAATKPFQGSSGPDDAREAATAHAAEEERTADVQLDLEDVTLPIAAPYLRKIVTELADNAFKFSKAGSVVSVSLRRAQDGGVVLDVADSGRGMSADQIPQVGAFRQFDRALFEQQGSGLGLSLVRGIVEGSGGRLDIEGRTGGGTLVRARWPPSS
jgi:two-component system sensor histidine kinase/response regulator